MAHSYKYFLLMPAIAYLLVMGIFPLLFSLHAAFHSNIAGEYQFVFLRNFFRILEDARFLNTLRVTITIMIAVIAIELLIGLGMTFLLAYLKMKGITYTLTQVVLLLPIMMPPIVVGYTWRLILDPFIGPINEIITSMGFSRVTFLTIPNTALLSVILCTVWYWAPFAIVSLYAGFRNIPEELYEAAAVDGATGWRSHRYLTIPLLKQVIVTVILLRIMDLLKLFDIVFVLTSGGPGTSTEVVTLYNYIVGFKYFDTGYASAISYIVLIFSIVISTIFSRLAMGEKK